MVFKNIDKPQQAEHDGRHGGKVIDIDFNQIGTCGFSRRILPDKWRT